MAVQPVLWPVSLIPSSPTSLSDSCSLFPLPSVLPLRFPSIPSPHTPAWPPSPGPPPDEVYAQKMKYKAISEELDNALNDITSL